MRHCERSILQLPDEAISLKMSNNLKYQQLHYRKMKINFTKIPWETPAVGVRIKKVVSGENQIRLVEFSEGFIEAEYCRKGHIGYVVEGSMKLDVNGKMVDFKAGEAFILPADDDAFRHKVVMGKGERVVLVLVEKV